MFQKYRAIFDYFDSLLVGLLECCVFNRPMDPELAQWVVDLEPPLAEKLAKVGLIPKLEAKAAATLQAFVESKV